ncbi:MAG: thioredoxin family protein [Bacteroidia bacterium]
MKITILASVLFCWIVVSAFTNSISIPLNSDKLENKNKDSVKAAKDEYLLNRRKLEKEERFSWFREGYAAYSPNTEIVTKLDDESRHLGFTVFGGSWCKNCQDLLPKFYKTMDAAKIPGSRIKLYGMDRNIKTVVHKNPMETVQDCGVKEVPTFIIFYDTKEVGRIVEKLTSESLEADILRIVEKAKADLLAEEKARKQ